MLIFFFFFKFNLISLHPALSAALAARHVAAGRGRAAAAVAPARCGGCGRPWPPPCSAASPGAGMAAPGTSRSRKCRPCTWTRSAWVSGAGALPPAGGSLAGRAAAPERGTGGNRWERSLRATSLAGIGRFLNQGSLVWKWFKVICV